MNARDFLTILPTFVSAALYFLMFGAFAWSMASRRRRRTWPHSALESIARAPRVSILKPLAGTDDELLENLRSFTKLDYPSCELLLGVASTDDPAYDVARRFAEEHRDRGVRLVMTDARAAINPKVAQLIGLEQAATGQVLVVSDANVRVDPDYLWPLVSALVDDGASLVSSVIIGTGERTLGAALENLQLGGFVAPGVVAAATLSNRPLTIGKSMAVDRRALARVGGFRRVASVLAEDHLLGRLFRQEGLRVAVSRTPVENRNVDCSLARTIERHTRWAKLRRAIEPRAFWAEPMLLPLVVASVTFISSPSKLTALLVILAAMLQTACAHLSLRALRGHGLPLRHAPLELVRTLVVTLCWARAGASRRVAWRGHPFVLGADSTITPVTQSLRHRYEDVTTAT
jgi:ceramide glucosyltransferase